MSACDNAIDHDLIKHRRLPALSIGIQNGGDTRLDLAMCPSCGTTIARPCVDARHLDASGWPICGVPQDGALLVSKRAQVDCPLCLDTLERCMP